MSEGLNQPEKKIIIDEDWKSQVEREREQSRQEPTGGSMPSAPPELPPPSLLYLASTFYYQASISLGRFPNPATGKPDVNLGYAKHAIDTLEILQQKTEGNRTPEESETLEGMLYELRMAYVQVNR